MTQTIGQKIAAEHYERVGGTTMWKDRKGIAHYPRVDLAAAIDEAVEKQREQVLLEKCAQAIYALCDGDVSAEIGDPYKVAKAVLTAANVPGED